MRKRLPKLLIGLSLGCAMPGCSNALPEQTPIELLPQAPLSVADWQKMPVSEKYDPSMFERLKLHNPTLASDAAWKQFMLEVVVPEREKDIPR